MPPVPDPAALDQQTLWHPFTQMREWMAGTPLVIVEAEGAILRDREGREYFDGNSSIWTNLHGHRRPEINAAIRAQLDRIAHSSFLGLTNDVAPHLAARLLQHFEGNAPAGARVFLSDDGSTAVEAGLKMIHQARMQRGETDRTMFISVAAGYHGDTVGAMSVGHSAAFHATYRSMLFDTCEVPSPACYRCPFNRAEPERGTDARLSRRCHWECVGEVERAMEHVGARATAFVMEPLVQGAGSMSMHPRGYLARVAQLCRERGIWLMLDEVLTGFGRSGTMFAFQKEEGVKPDVIALAKGLTGGYLPLAATIASREIFDAFLGEFSEYKTFFHGHSYTGNQLGCAAALASLDLLETTHDLEHIGRGAATLERLARRFWQHRHVGDVRCEGMICAVELVADFATRERFPAALRTGHRVCERARAHGLLTRPIGDVVVFMPPYCATEAQMDAALAALEKAICEVLP